MIEFFNSPFLMVDDLVMTIRSTCLDIGIDDPDKLLLSDGLGSSLVIETIGDVAFFSFLRP